MARLDGRTDPNGGWFWALTRYEDVRTVSRQPRRFSSYAKGVMIGDPDEASLYPQRQTRRSTTGSCSS